MKRNLGVVMAALFLFVGCATTQQANEAKRSGFLGSYAGLKEGKDGQALLVYRNPTADWGQYNKVMIDPVQVYAGSGSDLRESSAGDRRALASYFTAALHEQLGKKFRIVSTPGPGVLRLRTALTDADQSEVLLDTITTVMPIGLAVSTLKRASFGSDSFVGFAQAEAEVVDSLSTTRLAAAVDKRYGTKALRGKFGSWDHAQKAMDHWAGQIAVRLEEFGVRSIQR